MSSNITINIAMTPEGTQVTRVGALETIDQTQAPPPPMEEEAGEDIGLAAEAPPPPMEGEAGEDIGLAAEAPPPPMEEEADETVPPGVD